MLKEKIEYWKDKFSDEQKQILSYLGIIPETKNIDVNLIIQYIMNKLNQATEKGKSEMAENYQNILKAINQKSNGLNSIENNSPHFK